MTLEDIKQAIINTQVLLNAIDGNDTSQQHDDYLDMVEYKYELDRELLFYKRVFRQEAGYEYQ